METLQHIPNKPWATAPTPATTPAMIQGFCHRLFRERTCQARLGWLHCFGNDRLGLAPCHERLLSVGFIDELAVLDIELPGNP